MFPATEPYNSGYLAVSPRHHLYYEEVGRSMGTPIVFLHGGPGGGINPFIRKFFHPDHYRAVLFDQRGSGKSIPYGCIDENTTQDLIEDIEKLREHLNISSWIVMGGSWGSTLALLYAIAHPTRVRALILRGIFLARPQEIDWLYGPNGAARLFPYDYELFSHHLPLVERKQLIKSYLKRLTSPDERIQEAAVHAWNRWENGISQLIPSMHPDEFSTTLEEGLSIARIEAHYFVHNSFLPSQNYILENIAPIKEIPCAIVQGRYDVVCPAQSAYELHHALPLSTLDIIPDAGHSSVEPGIAEALQRALKKFRTL